MNVSQQLKLSSSVSCPVCGQGFLIYAESGIHAASDINRRLIQHVLRTHHAAQSASPNAHPGTTFHIPSWSGAQPLLASAALGNLLDSAV